MQRNPQSSIQAIRQRQVSRRNFLRGAAAVAGGLSLAPALQGLGLLASTGRAQAAPGDGGYGPLVPTPDLRDGVERLALPKGFKYRSFGWAGETMSDGNKTPLAHDGMGAFNMPDGTIRLVRNHEDRNGPGAGSTAGSAATKYDPLGGAGCTTLVINPTDRELVSDWISQNGSIVNCAGGKTPWGSWITCEETNAGPPTWGMQHGYAFDVPAAANTTVLAIPLPNLGRFSHEAVAVDPASWIVYETEDNGSNSGFYRFIANTPGNLTAGKLQMLAVDGINNYDTRTGEVVGVQHPVKWVDIANPNPPGTGSSDVFNQGFALGGARFARLEGCWYGNGAIYFVSTNGGNASQGQVWEYRPNGGGGTLTLVFESPSASVLNAPDNLAVTPQQALMLCEDGGGDQYIRVVTQEGTIFDFGLNLENDFEWAGATFAMHGSGKGAGEDKINGQSVTLFVNRQGETDGSTPPAAGDEGMTFAIWGPWNKGAI
jgi:secreted PhoX family phosphatase